MNRKTKIKFYSGLDTIGGVVMEIKYDEYRVLLEMGSAYNPEFDIFDGAVNIRNNHLKDLLWINDVPAIDGLFDSEQLSQTTITPAKKDNKTIVLLTHLHLDHMRNMGLVSDNVDVYLCHNAQIIEQALEDIGEGVYSLRHQYKDIPELITHGQIKIKPFILNDDSYKDYSFYIETPDLKMHYTGDVFVYGSYRDEIIKEAEYLNRKNIDILVCEGTSFLSSWLKVTTKYESNLFPSLIPVQGVIEEDEMLKNTQKIICNYDGLIIFNVYNREISHLRNWLDFAERSNRTIIFEPKTAYILNRFFNRKFNVLIPDTYDPDFYPDYLMQAIKENSIISKDELLKRPAKYIIQNSYENILELFDYRNINALYLHHSGTPLGDYDPAFKKMMLILNLCNIEYKHIYKTANGEFFPHAIANQLLWYIDAVNPKLLIPSHCPNRILEANSANRPYYLCKKGICYFYDKTDNTLKETAE